MHDSEAEADRLPPQALEAIRAVMVAMARRDDATALQAMGELSQFGHKGLFAACVAWADAVKVFGDLDAGDTFAGLVFVGPQGQIDPGDLPEQAQGVVWATQFVTAHINGDVQTQSALYLANANTGHMGQYIGELLNLASLAYREYETAR